MRLLLIALLSFIFLGCGPGDGSDTSINFAGGEGSTAGDPMTESNSGCANSDENCGQSGAGAQLE